MILDLLFPKTCFSCGNFGSYVCITCAHKIEKVIRDTCPYCKKPSLYGRTHDRCLVENGIDGLISVYRYRGVFARIIKGIKYQGVRSAFGNIFNTFPLTRKKDIATILLSHPDAVLVPIPLHAQRMRERGFNQAAVIAHFFGGLNGVQVEEHALNRFRSTAQQAKVADKNERYKNIQGAFHALNDRNVYKDVILVDDVWTTGATMREAAAVLKQAGCTSVYALTLAR